MNAIDALGSAAASGTSKGAHATKTPVVHDLSGELPLNWFGLTPNLQPGSSQSSSPSADMSFSALFANATNAPPSGSSGDPLAQLTAQVQNGTSISTIIDRLAQQIAGAVQAYVPATAATGSSGQLRSSLAAGVANALAPPGNAPPGTASQQVTALATRLQQWIAQLAGEAQSATQGQQNDISGNLLDAKSAKDIPAQRKAEPTSTLVDAASLAQALLGAAAAPATALNAAPPVPPAANATASAQPALSSAPPAITMSNAPDLLARMLVRAASTDATINGATASAQQPVAALGNAATATPASLAARFETALANAVTQAASPDTNANWNGSNMGGGHQSSQQSANQSSSQTMAGDGLVAGITPLNAPAPAAQSAGPQAPLVDADAVVEQVVKSMVMRTDQSGTSEVRLQLNPDNLGAVTMKLTITGSSVSANMVAQNPEVGNALSSSHQQLARSLSDAGLTLAGFSVDVSGGDAGRDQNRDRPGSFGRRYVVHEVGGSSDSQAVAPTTGGPQLLPGSSLELFNYLA